MVQINFIIAKWQQATSIILISLLVFSLFPSAVGAEGEEEQEKDVKEHMLITLNDEVNIKIDGVDQGTILKGTILYAEELETSYRIQWNNTSASIIKSTANVVKPEETPAYKEFDITKVIGQGELKKEVEVLVDEQFTTNMTLTKGSSYSVVGQTESGFKILLGNRLFEISKEHMVFTSGENSEETEKPTEPTNSEEEQPLNVEDEANAEEDDELPKETDKGTKSSNLSERIEPKEDVVFKKEEEQPELQEIKAAPVYGDYFEVIHDDVPVYDNRTDGKLIQVGTLVKGQTYKRVSDYGDWHRIKYGEYYGYVHQSSTKPSSVGKVNNLNNSYKNSSEKFIADDYAVVYDNSGSSLVPFTTIEEGEVFPIVSDYGNWYRVIAAGRVGYIQKNDVSGYFSASSNYFEVTVDNLSVFDNRGSGLEKIGELVKGQTYERVSDYGNWHRIKFGNHYGYVHESGTIASFKSQIPNYNPGYSWKTDDQFTPLTTATIYDNSSGQLVPFATLKPGEKHPIIDDYGDWYVVLIANRLGYVHQSNLTVPFKHGGRWFEVTIEELPVFDNPSGSLKQVGTLMKGETYERVSDYGNWHKIDFGAYYGYVYKEGTIPSTADEYENKVVGEDTRIGFLIPRFNTFINDNTGNNGLEPFAILKKGVTYQVVGKYGNWYEVHMGGRYGYIHKNVVDAFVR